MAILRFPNLAPTEDALLVAAKTIGALPQISGAATGFGLFDPTANCTYILAIRVQDVATGAPAHATMDLVTLTTVGTWTPTKMLASVTNVGTCVTTYSKNGSTFYLVVASGTTWYADIFIIRFPA